ncbi:MAG: hypothetical protein CSB49_08885 [Proteobacteria bacterium]|nr:MAG: hypothetical protein CSB49_08885 [Pseudomonadota bacterium]
MDPDSEIPIYRRVLAEIGDAQSLEQNLSTFTAHLKQLLDFLSLLERDEVTTTIEQPSSPRRRAPQRSLVLIDEIVTGTDPRQGEGLARALLEELVNRTGQLLVTTHYEGLKALPTHDHRFVNANVGFDLEQMQPTFTLHIGTPGTSFALPVARKLGLAERVAQRAESLLEHAENELSALLKDLADQRSKLLAEQDEARKARAQADELERRHRRKLAELKEQGQRALGRGHGEALAELKSARVDLSRARKALREGKLDEEKLRQLDRQVSGAARAIGSHEPRPEPPETKPLAIEDLSPGSEVYVTRLGGSAEVLSAPRKGRVEVRFGGMRTLVSVDELKVPTDTRARALKRAGTTKRRGGDPRLDGPKVVPTQGRTVDNTLDLRGKRVDEALRELDAFLDQALLEGRDNVYALHGRGTGALRSAIREHVQRSPVIADTREADPEEGGDAVTLLELR